MVVDSFCPSEYEIEQTLLGLLPDEQLLPIQQHLLECPTCVETAHSLNASDTLVASLRFDPTVYAETCRPAPEVKSVIDRFISLGLHRGRGTGEEHAAGGGYSAATGAFLLADAVDLPDPVRLGNYVLLEKIGGGGMGRVFKARHGRMDRIVAIKVLSPRIAKDETAIARFEREVKASAKLFHPNIVTALDAD